MSATVAELAERALRRLGVAIVPVADRPAISATVPLATIAQRALVNLGVYVDTGADLSAPAFVPSAVVATNALIELGVVAGDEVPTAYDQDYAIGKVSEVLSSLVAQDLVYWTSGLGIPTEIAEEFTKLVALLMASSFGLKSDPAQWATLEARIRKVAQMAAAQARAEARLAALQDSLIALGFVSWSSATIPQSLAEDYTMLLTVDLAPSFGGKADAAQWSAAMAQLRKTAMVMSSVTVATEAVQAVHDGLVATGRARWTVFDIPPAAEFPYVVLAANMIAPAFELKPDPQGGQMANIALAQITALPSSGEPLLVDYF